MLNGSRVNTCPGCLGTFTIIISDENNESIQVNQGENDPDHDVLLRNCLSVGAHCEIGIFANYKGTEAGSQASPIITGLLP